MQQWSPNTFAGILVYRIGSRGLAAILQASVFLLLARTLDPQDFGVVVLGQSIGSVAAGVVGLGLPNLALRVGRSEPDIPLAPAIIALGALQSLASAVVAAVVVVVLGTADVLLVLAASVPIAGDHFLNVNQALLAGIGRQASSANLVVIYRLLVLLPMLVSAFIIGRVVEAYAACQIAAFFVALVLGGRRWGMTAKVGLLLRMSMGYWANSMSSMLTSIDLTIVRLTMGTMTVGLYGAATRLVSPLSIAVGALLSVLVPTATLAETREEFDKLFATAYRGVLLFALLLVVLSYPLSNVAVWVLGDDYCSSRPIVASVVVGVAFSAVSQVIVAEHLAWGRPWLSAWSIAIGSVVGLVGLAGIGMFLGSEFAWIGPVLIQALILSALLVGRIHLDRPDGFPVSTWKDE